MHAYTLDSDGQSIKETWRGLEQQHAVFPQQTWDWWSSWRDTLGSRYTHRVFAVGDALGALGLTPFAVVQNGPFRTLMSSPINYCDMHAPITREAEATSTVVSANLDRVERWEEWDAVVIGPTKEGSPFHSICQQRGFEKLPYAKNIVASLDYANWDSYLSNLSANRRRLTTKKMRRLERAGSFNVLRVDTPADYEEWAPEIQRLHRKRSSEGRPTRSRTYEACVYDSHTRLLSTRSMVLYLLILDSRLIACRAGLLFDRHFYDWATAYDSDFEQLSPGLLSIAYVIRDLIERGYRGIDFMSGAYDYKRSYSPEHVELSLDRFFACSPSARGHLLKWWHLSLRDRARAAYHQFRHWFSRRKDARPPS